MNFRFILYSLITVASIFISSCNDNDPYPAVYPTMGTVTELTNYSINSDKYGLIIPNNPDIVRINDADSIGQRILINIDFPNKTDESKSSETPKEVKIYDIYKVLTKKADDLRSDNYEENEDFGDNEIRIKETSISDEHLNIEFIISGNDGTIPHRISLLLTEDTHIDDEGLINVELKHNNNSDFGNREYWGLVSFTLKSIPECHNPNFKGFKIIYKSSVNTKTEWIVKKSNDRSIPGIMKSSKEISDSHTFFPCNLQ